MPTVHAPNTDTITDPTTGRVVPLDSEEGRAILNAQTPRNRIAQLGFAPTPTPVLGMSRYRTPLPMHYQGAVPMYDIYDPADANQQAVNAHLTATETPLPEQTPTPNPTSTRIPSPSPTPSAPPSGGVNPGAATILQQLLRLLSGQNRPTPAGQ